MHFFNLSTSKTAPNPSVFNTFYFQMCFAPQRRALFQHVNFQKWSEPPVFNTFYFQMCFAPQRRALFNISTSKNGSKASIFNTSLLPNVLRATTPCTFSTSQLPKVVRTPQFLTHFTAKCASRHNAVHLFNISTSKSGPNPSVFNTFYFQMCFAPQRRALCQHLNFQKWSDAEVFCTVSL